VSLFLENLEERAPFRRERDPVGLVLTVENSPCPSPSSMRPAAHRVGLGDRDSARRAGERT